MVLRAYPAWSRGAICRRWITSKNVCSGLKRAATAHQRQQNDVSHIRFQHVSRRDAARRGSDRKSIVEIVGNSIALKIKTAWLPHAPRKPGISVAVLYVVRLSAEHGTYNICVLPRDTLVDNAVWIFFAFCRRTCAPPFAADISKKRSNEQHGLLAASLFLLQRYPRFARAASLLAVVPARHASRLQVSRRAALAWRAPRASAGTSCGTLSLDISVTLRATRRTQGATQKITSRRTKDVMRSNKTLCVRQNADGFSPYASRRLAERAASRRCCRATAK